MQWRSEGGTDGCTEGFILELDDKLTDTSTSNKYLKIHKYLQGTIIQNVIIII